MQRLKNPVLNRIDSNEAIDRSYTSSYAGVTLKTAILLLVTVLSGGFAWYLLNTNVDAAITILAVTGITSFISVLLASFIPRLAMPFSILYSAAQGFSLGLLTIIADLLFPGIGITAVIITVVIFGVMLALYSSRTLRATTKFRKIMFTSLISILIFSIISILIPPINNLFVNNLGLAILLSAIFILFGAFMLIMNFDQAEQVVNSGAPKNYEWSVALGLIVTIIWIYVEVLRLLIIIFANSNKD